MKLKKEERIFVGGIAVFAIVALGILMSQHSDFYNRLYQACEKNRTGEVALTLLDCHCVAERAERVKDKMGLYALYDPQTWSSIAMTCVK